MPSSPEDRRSGGPCLPPVPPVNRTKEFTGAGDASGFKRDEDRDSQTGAYRKAGFDARPYRMFYRL